VPEPRIETVLPCCVSRRDNVGRRIDEKSCISKYLLAGVVRIGEIDEFVEVLGIVVVLRTESAWVAEPERIVYDVGMTVERCRVSRNPLNESSCWKWARPGE
jgi:hypothetical protein